MSLVATEVKSLNDIELFRIIRNQNVENFSHNAHQTTREEQYTFWELNKHNIRAWIYDDLKTDEGAVGIGSLRRDETGKLWAFVAVDSFYRGRGYSKVIMQHLLDMAAPEDVWGKNSMNNPPATYLCVDTGIWRMVSREHEIITVVYKREDNQ